MADCLISPVQEIGKCIWPFLKPHVDYWWCFDSNIQGLSDEVRDLDRQIYDFKQKIEDARLRREVVRPGVQEWLEASTQKLEEARRILLPDHHNIPKAWDLISRYSMGKNAKTTAQDIAKFRNEGNFNPIADPAPPAAMASPPRGSTTNFESRKGIEDEIIDALKQSSVGMIGFCGMGGVGKTTMAQRIRERVKEEDLFDEVVMVTLSQTIDMLKIQNEIAELLGLKFDVTSIPARADKLRTRLMDTKRKIIILDDVWDPILRFEDLGIHIESNFERCKVLLTSRSRDTCKRFKNKVVFDLKILEEEEAWILFKDKAGKCDEDSALLRVAKDVAEECKGLPIALVTVGKALQDEKNICIWKDSLSQLRQSNPIDFPEVLTNVYKPLKLSYDYLENDRERDIFLMCCLFHENYYIPIDELTWYSMGLRLFDGITNIEDARNRTHRLVEKLKSRSLLIHMDGCNGLFVKMHDVVRDMAIYIGSRKNHGFLKSLHRSSIENSSDVNLNCNWMSVDISNEQMEVPVLSRFPKLRLLMLSSSNEFYDISHISFEGMEDLNVLSFQSISIRSLPPTLGSLENLQTLHLFRCKVENISVIGKLTSLKILSCCRCANITELPAEIGRLKGLRLLELNGCFNLQRIPFGIISSLFLLEELKISRCFSEWETGGERRNASLTELERLRNLTCLEIEISDCTSTAQEIRLSQKLVRYRICIAADSNDYFENRDYEKVMNLNLAGAVGNWIQLLARNAECLSLRGDGSDNINLAEMENLRNLKFTNCSTVDTSYLNQNVSLCNLKSIYIRECSNLKHVFSVSVATTILPQLEFLDIGECVAMEQVFWNEVRDDTYGCIEFPKLKKLKLYNLQNLTAFCKGLENIIIKFPHLTQMSIGILPKLNSLFPLNSETVENTCFHLFCNPKVEMCGLKILTLYGLKDPNIRNIWCSQIPNVIFNNLEILNIHFINGIRSLMSTSIAKNLVSLRRIRINDCPEMVELIERDDNDKQVIDIKCLFPNLKSLNIVSMPKLRRFWQWNHALELPLLEYVRIYTCPVMETFTLGFIYTPKIRAIHVNSEQIDDQKDLNDVIRHIWIESQDKSKAEEDGDKDDDENENKYESKLKYTYENVYKDEEDNETK